MPSCASAAVRVRRRGRQTRGPATLASRPRRSPLPHRPVPHPSALSHAGHRLARVRPAISTTSHAAGHAGGGSGAGEVWMSRALRRMTRAPTRSAVENGFSRNATPARGSSRALPPSCRVRVSAAYPDISSTRRSGIVARSRSASSGPRIPGIMTSVISARIGGPASRPVSEGGAACRRASARASAPLPASSTV